MQPIGRPRRRRGVARGVEPSRVFEKRGVAGGWPEFGVPLAPGWRASFGGARQSDAMAGGMLPFCRVVVLVDLGRRDEARVLAARVGADADPRAAAIVREIDRIVAEH
jgi:hypothetical protein